MKIEMQWGEQMFYKMLEKARDAWYISSECTVSDLISYMEQKGELRDAQIDAIKTYLYLKIACQCQPLRRLFIQGKFNSMDLDALPLSTDARAYLKGNRAAAALLEYASLTDKDGQVISPKLKGFLFIGHGRNILRIVGVGGRYDGIDGQHLRPCGTGAGHFQLLVNMGIPYILYINAA